MWKKLFGASLAIALTTSLAFAQTSPGLTQGQKLTPAQWNNLFASKQDTLGFTPLNAAGGVMTGRLVTAAPGASTAGFNFSVGTAPASPVNGDMWVTATGAFIRVNGSTLALGSSSGTVQSVAMTVPSIFSLTGSPITVSGTLGLSLANQSANLVFAGPSSGGASTPAFRSLVNADFPSGFVNAGTGLTGGALVGGGSIAIDKASTTEVRAGTSNKVLTADNIYVGEVAGGNISGSVTLDFGTFTNNRYTLTGNVTSLTCSNIKDSQNGVITFVQDGTGSRTMVAAWCSQFRWANGVRGTLSTTASATDALFYNCPVGSSPGPAICYVNLGKAQAN